ncbi:MAG: DUF4124 domain-containing protein [Pseudomonas sp.]
MRFILLCLLLIGLPVAAEVYTYIDNEGNRVFTDQPKPGNAKRIELAPSNSMPTNSTPPPAPVQAAPATPPAYQLLRILIPEPDATIRDGSSGDLIVTATSEPGLLAGHNYRLLLDGQTVGGPSRSPVFPLSNLARGTHQLAVEILDSNGRTLERTPNQPVHVLRISLEQKRMVRPCKIKDYGVRPECPLKDKPPIKKDFPFLPFI